MLRNLYRTGQVLFDLLRMWRDMRRADPSVRPVILRRTLERLSGTFVKFGQVLALRPDLLPRNYCIELFRLLDQVPPFSYEAVCRIIEEDLGQPPTVLFKNFEPEPLASASFGQVHRAVTMEDDLVAVKVQRPGIRKLVETDLNLMSFLSSVLDFSGISGNQKTKPTIDEFARLTRQELDYTIEARHNDFLYQTSQTNFKQKIPRTFWQYISSRVLTNEYLDGIVLSQIMNALYEDDQAALASYHKRKLDFFKVSQNLWECLGEQVYEHGFFHADPHPANIIVLDNNVLGYVDFGIVGWMPPSLRTNIMRLVRASAEGDYERAAEYFLEIAPPTARTDLRGFRRSFVNSVHTWKQLSTNKAAPFRERSFSTLFIQHMQMVKTYHLQPTSETLAYFRTILTVDSITLQVAPEFDSNANAILFFRDMDRKRRHQVQQQLLSPDFFQQLFDYAVFIRQLPRNLSDWLYRLENQSVQSRWTPWQQQHSHNAYGRATTVGMLLLTAAVTLNVIEDRRTLGVPLFDMLFGVIILLSLWLILMLRRLQ